MARSHKIRFGESLWELAQKYGVGFQEIIDANPQIRDPNRLYPGDVINVPNGVPAPPAVAVAPGAPGAYCSPVDDGAFQLIPRGWVNELSFNAVYGPGLGKLSGKHHSGVDIAAHGCEGKPIYAIGDSKVAFAGNPSNDWGWGNIIILSVGGGFYVRYAHMRSIEVKTGARVDRGTRMGTIGRGENNVFAPHLHFDARNMPYRNPSMFSAGTAAQISKSYISPFSLYPSR